MINSQELRIGNYVLADGKLQQISTINEQASVKVTTRNDDKELSVEYAVERITPVLLTDGILKQCGFRYHDYFKFWQLVEGKDETRSEMDIDPDYNVIDFMRKPVVKKVLTLHQLQNVYFMLKGRELNVEETEKAATLQSV